MREGHWRKKSLQEQERLEQDLTEDEIHETPVGQQIHLVGEIDACWLWRGLVTMNYPGRNRPSRPPFAYFQRNTDTHTDRKARHGVVRWLRSAVSEEEIAPGVYIARTCYTPGCINPLHHAHDPSMSAPARFEAAVLWPTDAATLAIEEVYDLVVQARAQRPRTPARQERTANALRRLAHHARQIGYSPAAITRLTRVG